MAYVQSKSLKDNLILHSIPAYLISNQNKFTLIYTEFDIDSIKVDIINILNLFIERYDIAYKNQLDNFVNCIIDKKSPTVNFEDGRIALIIANAAYKSLENKKSVRIDYS